MNPFSGILRAVSCTILALSALLLSGCASAFRDDSHYVALRGGSGFYLVRPDSPLRDQLKLTYAPTSDTGSPLHRGHGADVLAFRFNHRGVLAASPAYICQLRPDSGIVNRLRAFTEGRSSFREMERLFGRIHTTIPKPEGLLVYYTIPVYNPLEESPSAGFR